MLINEQTFQQTGFEPYFGTLGIKIETESLLYHFYPTIEIIIETDS